MATAGQYLFHGPSGNRMLIHPYHGHFNPDNNTSIVMGPYTDEPARLQFRFIRANSKFGYIQHNSSGKVVRPRGGSVNPSDNTDLVLYSDKDDSALFYFEANQRRIVHKSGKVWYKNGSYAGGTNLVLHGEPVADNSAAQFYMGELDGFAASVQLTPSHQTLII